MKRKELEKTMQTVVNKCVKHYKTDFEYDKQTLAEHPEPYTAIWLVRDSGTFLPILTSRLESPYNFIESVCETMRVLHMFRIDHRGGEYDFREVTLEQVREFEKYAQTQKYRVTDRYGRVLLEGTAYDYKDKGTLKETIADWCKHRGYVEFYVWVGKV